VLVQKRTKWPHRVLPRGLNDNAADEGQFDAGDEKPEDHSRNCVGTKKRRFRRVLNATRKTSEGKKEGGILDRQKAEKSDGMAARKARHTGAR